MPVEVRDSWTAIHWRPGRPWLEGYRWARAGHGCEVFKIRDARGLGEALIELWCLATIRPILQAIPKGRLPDFIGVGPARTGTTWLHDVLRGHVGLAHVKETHFFSTNYDKGTQWYADLFRDCPPDRPSGEISPSYFGTVEAPARMRNLIPECRIICTLREPVGRLYSHYRLMRHYGWTKLTFAEFADTPSLATDANRYAYHIGRWREMFGADGVLIALYDDLENDPQRFLDPVCEFIGIARISLDGSPLLTKRVNRVTQLPRSALLAERAWRLRQWLRARHAERTATLLRKAGLWRLSFRGGGEFAALDGELERRLRRRLLPEVEALEELTGRDLSAWKCSSGEQAG